MFERRALMAAVFEPHIADEPCTADTRASDRLAGVDAGEGATEPRPRGGWRRFCLPDLVCFLVVMSWNLLPITKLVKSKVRRKCDCGF